jgi:hypothetical protein
MNFDVEDKAILIVAELIGLATKEASRAIRVELQDEVSRQLSIHLVRDRHLRRGLSDHHCKGGVERQERSTGRDTPVRVLLAVRTLQVTTAARATRRLAQWRVSGLHSRSC